MPAYLENLNMDFFKESDESYASLIKFTVSEGKAIRGYYNLPYLNKHLGSAQIIVRTGLREQSEEVNGLCICDKGMDTHVSGPCVWTVRLHEMNIDRQDGDLLMKRVVVMPMDGGSMAVVNLVNADVLPSFMKDDVVKMQMVAFPELIEYYKDAKDYASHQPAAKDGQKYLIGEGTVFPTGMMRNRNPDSSEFESDEGLDDLTAVCGIVKGLYWGKVELEGESHNAFLACIIDTNFGELEIVHTVEQVSEELRCNMKVGATVVMYGTLSGDVAIYKYDQGIVRDEANMLAAMRYTFSGNDPERIRSILAEDAVYISKSGNIYKGAENIIAQLKFVQAENPDKYFAHFATIVKVDEGEDELDYGVDKKCLILAAKEERNFESIAFFDYDDAGNICRIVTTANPRYHFTIPALIGDDDDDEES